ncbi:type II toxin-antitoxin system HicA family toxin [Candidatus Magnetobacterium casense]
MSGKEFAKLLRKYEYKITRQRSSHIRVVNSFTGLANHVTIPNHSAINI